MASFRRQAEIAKFRSSLQDICGESEAAKRELTLYVCEGNQLGDLSDAGVGIALSRLEYLLQVRKWRNGKRNANLLPGHAFKDWAEVLTFPKLAILLESILKRAD